MHRFGAVTSSELLAIQDQVRTGLHSSDNFAALAELDLPIEAGDAEALTGRVLAGGWYGIFSVKDARSSLDSARRHIIPAQDFVAEQQIKSVWGIGVATLISFTREELDRSRVEALVSASRMFRPEARQLAPSIP